jgi:L-methionine (R)-S-oxide reductase
MSIPLETLEYLCRSLKMMGDLFAVHDTLDRLLEGAARAMGELLGVDHALVVWAADTPLKIRVRAMWSRPGVMAGPTLSDQIVAFLESSQQIRSAGRGSISESWVASEGGKAVRPLKVKEELVGYLVVLPRIGAPSDFSDSLFTVIGEQIGQMIEVHQTRQFLASRYSALALWKETGEETEETQQLDGHLVAAVRNPDKVARLLARSFYRDLRKAGFDANQVLLVASEIIGNLTETIRKTRAKTDKSANPE